MTPCGRGFTLPGTSFHTFVNIALSKSYFGNKLKQLTLQCQQTSLIIAKLEILSEAEGIRTFPCRMDYAWIFLEKPHRNVKLFFLTKLCKSSNENKLLFAFLPLSQKNSSISPSLLRVFANFASINPSLWKFFRSLSSFSSLFICILILYLGGR